MQVLTTWLFLSMIFCSQVSAQTDLAVSQDEMEEEEILATPTPTPTAKVISSNTINVDGYIKEEKPLSDPELQQIQAEIKRQKTETVLNKEKAKNFKVLKKSIEQLSETTEEYLEEKRAAKAEIAEYNLKVKCLQTEDTSSECARYVRKK